MEKDIFKSYTRVITEKGGTVDVWVEGVKIPRVVTLTYEAEVVSRPLLTTEIY